MGFDFALARKLAQISQHVYTFDDEGLAGLGSPQFFSVHDDKNEPTAFAAVYLYQDHTVVAFRGTMLEIDDWLKNFETTLVATELGGKVHSGFYQELMAIQPKIDDVLREHHLPGKPLYVTGHSQGAAEAVLATRHLPLNGFNVTATYTFAAPRPGDQRFRDLITTEVHRVEYGNDIVPHVPPNIPGVNIQGILGSIGSWLTSLFATPMVKKLVKLSKKSAGYCSVGPLSYAAAGGELRVDLGAVEEASLFTSRLTNVISGAAEVVSDHNMDNYIRIVTREDVAQPTSRGNSRSLFRAA